MNCIILLLLLGCCGGWGNGSGGSCCGNDCGCAGIGRRDRTDGCPGGRNRAGRGHDDGDCGRRHDSCGCEQERPCGGPEPCGCAREERECDSSAPGMIPPPWQDYPKFPRRDSGEDCES